MNGCKEPYFHNLESYIFRELKYVNVSLLQTNISGVSHARNIGLDIAQGEYITFVDDDDYISASYLEELYQKSSPNVIALSYGVTFGEEQNSFSYRVSKEYAKKYTLGIQHFSKIRHYFSGPWMKLIHRDIIGDRRFDVSFENGEDSLFMFLISDRIRNVDFTSNSAIYYRRFRPNSATTKQRSCLQRMLNACRLVGAYTNIYFRKSSHYDLRFYITRILGTLKAVFVR